MICHASASLVSVVNPVGGFVTEAISATIAGVDSQGRTTYDFVLAEASESLTISGKLFVHYHPGLS
jgi:hypothetical protein